ncbi:c-type cytochrome [Tanticharoenia sakaeratensis]|uniref:Gluconate 2-dehydrogenase n=1 Tax=Tanticharoenia sakaeratensis NBRC 103193 TaxID=1231623 RepID=A0A0D6MQ37_9PROT|nr:cytochrome c [Tanticharoenia sakaeratensis]GAN55566.1 gluconate 2-dehydrogenase [Tanticharoenia sakaeratensis NBRC 103193]GBQ21720.1 gluconate 2-dehydrogenase, cytochrome c subunit [Tanticharoenia sakaeratensis NBRC 103193]
MRLSLVRAAVATLGLASSLPALAQDRPTQALIAQGEYLAHASDCSACHTISGGAAYAGGLPFKLPMGTIYAPNITPDKTYGIGNDTEADFARALRDGIRHDGASLYPAMPYPSYARMTDADIHALYAYFHYGVAPVAYAPPASTIHWPMSMRWPMTIWRRMFSPAPADALQKTARHFDDPAIARGAYLVEGPGHCGACHTPRAATLQEKALTASDGTVFLSGGDAIDGWVPPSLRQENRTGLGRWTEDDLVAFLKTGRMAKGVVFGGMADAVEHGTQHLTDADLHAIAKYLLTLSPADTHQTPWQYDGATEAALHSGNASARGAYVYVNNCAACHRDDGHGYAGVFPPLAGNPVVMTDNPASLVHIVQTGGLLPSMIHAPSAFTMPGFAHRLTDQQIADVVTFIRNAWGNDAPAVSAQTVSALKASAPPPVLVRSPVPMN